MYTKLHLSIYLDLKKNKKYINSYLFNVNGISFLLSSSLINATLLIEIQEIIQEEISKNLTSKKKGVEKYRIVLVQ